jgi:hypothetical protein
MELVFGKKWLWQHNQESGTYEIFIMNGSKIEKKIASFYYDDPDPDFEIDEFMNTVVAIHNETISIQESDYLYFKLTQCMLRLIGLRRLNAAREIMEMNVGLVYDAIDEIIKRDMASSKYFQHAFTPDDDTSSKDGQ